MLFTTDTVRDLAQAADVQLNFVLTGAASDALDALARDTGGRSFSEESGVADAVIRDRGEPAWPDGQRR